MSDTETSTQTSDEDSGISENETDDGQPAAKKKCPRYRKPIAFENSDNDSREATPITFFRSRYAALERIKDTPSRESTPGPSPIPTRLTRPQQLKDDSSRASTPNSEISSNKSAGRRGRGRGRKGRRDGRSACRKVNLEEDKSNSNLPDGNDSVVSNDLSADINESSLMEAEDAEKEGSVRTPEPDKLSNHSDQNRLAAEDNSDSSFSVDKISSRASSQGKIEDIEERCSGINGSQDKALLPSDNEDCIDRKMVISSQDSASAKSNGNPVPSRSPSDCDKSLGGSEKKTESSGAQESNVPFDSYKKESECKNSDQIVRTSGETKELVDDCQPSTSGMNPSAQLVMKEESNDSASTSPYSVSEMSVDEMDSLPNNTSDNDAMTIKAEIKQERNVKMEETSFVDGTVKLEIKKEECEKTENCKDSLVNGDIKPKVETGGEEDKSTMDCEVKSEEMKTEIKEEEQAEESEDEEPEVTVRITTNA